MSAYTGNSKAGSSNQTAPDAAVAQGAPGQPGVQPEVQIDGFQQVLDMLKIADPAFRESLLKRLASRDRSLANSLRRDLADQGL